MPPPSPLPPAPPLPVPVVASVVPEVESPPVPKLPVILFGEQARPLTAEKLKIRAKAGRERTRDLRGRALSMVSDLLWNCSLQQFVRK